MKCWYFCFSSFPSKVKSGGVTTKWLFYVFGFQHLHLSSVAQLYPTVCYCMDCSMPGFPVDDQLPQFTILFWNYSRFTGCCKHSAKWVYVLHYYRIFSKTGNQYRHNVYIYIYIFMPFNTCRLFTFIIAVNPLQPKQERYGMFHPHTDLLHQSTHLTPIFITSGNH